MSQYFIHCALLRLSSQSVVVIHSHCLSGLPIFNSKFTFYKINIKSAMFGKSLSADFPRWGRGGGGGCTVRKVGWDVRHTVSKTTLELGLKMIWSA